MAIHDCECWTCRDFGDLPGLGPCPDCRRDAHIEHILAHMDGEPTSKEECDV